MLLSFIEGNFILTSQNKLYTTKIHFSNIRSAKEKKMVIQKYPRIKE